jgi:APA family basic amino acid/polyamine antiporter
VGNTIGAGILRTPGNVAENLPSTWIYIAVWVAGGLFAMMAAFSVAELGAMLPRSGGHYIFPREALGDYAGFVVGWSDWLSNCGSTSAVSIAAAEYIAMLWPQASGHTAPVAAGIVIFFLLIQWRGVVWGSTTQNLITVIKALGFLALIAAIFIFSRGAAAMAAPAPSHSLHLLGLVLALQAVIYTYDGWAGAIYFAEELQDPSSQVPRSIFGGLASVAAIYLLMNVALVYALPLEQIAGSKFAIGDAARNLWGVRGLSFIQVVSVISFLAAINAYQLMASRIPRSMAADGLFPRVIARVNQGGTPDFSLFLSIGVSLLFIATGSFEQVIAVLAFFFAFNYILDMVSVYVLRRKQPERARPYRAFGYPWSTLIAVLMYLGFLASAVIDDTRNSIYSVLLLAASYPIHRFLSRDLKA